MNRLKQDLPNKFICVHIYFFRRKIFLCIVHHALKLAKIQSAARLINFLKNRDGDDLKIADNRYPTYLLWDDKRKLAYDEVY